MTRVVYVVSAVLWASCGGDAPPGQDAPDGDGSSEVDAPSDADTAEPDTALDTTPDAQPDTSPDTTTDSSADTAADTRPDGDVGPTPLEPLFTTAAVHDFAFELDETAWATLREQRRSYLDMFAGDCQADEHVSPFTWFRARLTVDGVAFEDVGVRKKGWIGSVTSDRPSLKLKLDRYVDGQELAGFDDVILNNSLQDPSYVRQCLGYALFEAAGIPSPRCGFARVRVNGEDLGLYVLVEAVDKDFLRARFTNPNGNMYEGVHSDFREGWLGTFEPETNEDVTDKSDLAAVAAALDTSDEGLVAALEQVLDVDRFLTYWAMENLLGHGDGYASHAINYHVYRDPLNGDVPGGRFVFLPHGIDYIMQPDEAGQAPSSPIVYAHARLPGRLLDLPATRERMVARLRELLDTVWDEQTLGAEIDRLRDVIAPHVADTQRLTTSFTGLRNFIAGRRGQIEATLAAGPLPPSDLMGSVCWPFIGTFGATFSTTMGNLLGGGPPGTGTAELVIDGQAVTLSNVTARVGQVAGSTVYLTVNARAPDGGTWRVELELDPSRVRPSTSALDWLTDSVSIHAPGEVGGSVVIGYGGPGTVVLDQADLTPGTPFSGTITGQVTATSRVDP